MTDDELDEAYTATCRALAAVGEDHARLYLARLALLLMLKLDDPAAIRTAIDDALAATRDGAGASPRTDASPPAPSRG